MAGSSDNTFRVVFYELFPINSLKRARDELRGANWPLFTYRLFVVGVSILLTSFALVVLLLYVFQPIVNAESIQAVIVKTMGNITLAGVIIYLFVRGFSIQLNDLTESDEPPNPNTRIGLWVQRLIYSFLSGLFIWFAIQFRLSLTKVEVISQNDDLVTQAGRVFGLVLLDSFYFGLLLAGIGLLSTIWLIDSKI